MSMEALLLATVVREAADVPVGRRGVSVRFTDCRGNFAYAMCSSSYPATVEQLDNLRLGDPVSIRGHVAIARGSRKDRLGSLEVSITGLTTLGANE